MHPYESTPPYYRARQLLRHAGYRCRWEALVGDLTLAAWISRTRRGTILLQKDQDGEITLFTESGVPTEWTELETWLASAPTS